MINITKKLMLTCRITLILVLVSGIIQPAFAINNTTTVKAIAITDSVGDVTPWEINRIGADLVHEQNKGQGVKIAVLDTGIDLNHPDLKVAGNISFVSGTTDGDDDNGHGTMVAGIIAAQDNGKGIIGIAPEAEIYAVKVLDNQGEGQLDNVVAGIKWAIVNKMDIINISFGTLSDLSNTEKEVLQNAYDAGILVIAGAGNSGDLNTIFAPARYDSVIAVGAIDYQDKRAEFSGTGAELELVAPGTNIMTTILGGGYNTASGTSLATAVVSGAAALLIASGITSNIVVRNILETNVRDLGVAGRDNEYGFGCLYLGG